MRIIGFVCLLIATTALATLAALATAQSIGPATPTLQYKIPIPAGCTASMTVSEVTITCNPAPPPPPPFSITTPIIIPAATALKPFSVDISKLVNPTGGKPPYTFTPGKTFPTWLTLSPVGVLSGIPPAAGNFPISFNVTDSSSPIAAKSSGVVLSVQKKVRTTCDNVAPDFVIACMAIPD